MLPLEAFNLKEHEKIRIDVMSKILPQLQDNLVLKGGTALLFGYGLPRFSEDIDLDVINPKKNVKKEIASLKIPGYNLQIEPKKDTSTTYRVLIDYGGKRSDLPEDRNVYKLKLEVSMRRRLITPAEYTVIDGIKIYNIEQLIQQKIAAFGARNKARDIYDVGFLLENYSQSFSLDNYRLLSQFMETKDIDALSFELKHSNMEQSISGLKYPIDPDTYALRIEENIEKGLDWIENKEKERLATNEQQKNKQKHNLTFPGPPSSKPDEPKGPHSGHGQSGPGSGR